MIRIIKPGLYTSIQDLGRYGYRNYGIPLAGAMDQNSARLSNLILGNDENDATIEITMLGPQIEFLSTTFIAITGADLSPALNNKPIKVNLAIPVQKGDVLTFGARKNGVRSYLSVIGGFQTDLIYGSRSYYNGITPKEKLESEDLLIVNLQIEQSSSLGQVKELQVDNPELLAYPGPEFDLLSQEQKECIASQSFTLGLNNRMGYQLKESIPNKLNPILSSAVLPGTVQLTPSGKMIVLMRDCQTTGGYPRILQLTENSINYLAQKMQHESIKFEISEII